jgi:tRNA uridine 5-carboxymethylaminomethyl modification enzyme
MMSLKIPEDFVYDNLPGLSTEVIEKLRTFNPPTLFSASQISGITPSAIDILHLNIDLQSKKQKKGEE